MKKPKILVVDNRAEYRSKILRARLDAETVRISKLHTLELLAELDKKIPNKGSN